MSVLWAAIFGFAAFCGFVALVRWREVSDEAGERVGDDGPSPAVEPLNEVDRFRRDGAL